MSSLEWPDLSRLAFLARNQTRDVRPLLLRVQTDLFVSAPGRDRATIDAFEALVLGFLPTVDDETATLVAQKLAPVADTPRAILDALIRRGGAARQAVLAKCQDLAADEPGAEAEDPPAGRCVDDEADILLARNRFESLAGARLAALVERARTSPPLALALLGRGDLSPADEAVLYLYADDAQRTRIRERLAPLVALRGVAPSLPRADAQAMRALLACARRLDVAGFEAQLADLLRLDPAPTWRFQSEPRREFLALAMVAAGVAPEDCIRVFLTLHPAISHSVKTVFHLAQVARSVSRPLAVYLLEAALGIRVTAAPRPRHIPAADPSATPARGHAARLTVAEIRARVRARRTG